jgi:transposase-like protein
MSDFSARAASRKSRCGASLEARWPPCPTGSREPSRSTRSTHKNAYLTPKGREAMARSVIEGGLSKAAAARQFNTTPKTVAKWVARFRAKGGAGLQDRSSRPHSSPSQTAAKPNRAGRMRCGRRFTQAASYWRADRRRGRRFGGNCQPHPQTPGPQSPVGARAGRTGPSL